MDSPSSKPTLFSLILFALFAALVIPYYLVHKPFSPQLAVELVQRTGSILAAAGIIGLAGGMGHRFVHSPGTAPLALLTVHAAFGLGILALVWLLCGSFARAYNPVVGWALLAGGWMVFRRDIRAWVSGWTEVGDAWRETGRFGKLSAAYLIAVFSLTLLPALAPPVQFDALTYHLTLPRLYIAAGRFQYLPEIMFWGMPQNGEMLYTWGILLAGERTATMLGWFFGLLAAVGVLGFTRSRLGSETGWLAAAVLLSGYTLAASLSWGYVDWLAILVGAGWLAVLDTWTGERRSAALILSGLLAGLAVGTKYTAGILMICGAAVILWTQRRNLKAGVTALGFYTSAVIAAVLPWLVKNWIATGSPIYPLIVPAGAMTPLRLSLYQGGKAFGGLFDVLFLPVRATWIGVEGGQGYSASIGPLLIGLSICVPLAWPRLSDRGRLSLHSAGAAAISGLVIWAAAGRFSSYLLQSRLYFAVFPALAFLAAAGWYGLRGLVFTVGGKEGKEQLRLGRIFGALILLVLGLNLFELWSGIVPMGAAGAVIGLTDRSAYLADNLGGYAASMDAVKQLSSRSRTLLLWEPRSYLCAPSCDPDEILDRWLRARWDGRGEQPRSNPEIVANWRAAGYTHLLFHKTGADFIRREAQPVYTQTDWQALDALTAGLTSIRTIGDGYVLYALDR